MDTQKNKGELSFQSIFNLIKKGGVKIIVSVVIVAIVVGLIGGIVIFAKHETASFQSIIEFNYKGVEDGLDPWGKKLDVNKIKADKIITTALIENNYSEERRLSLKRLIKDNLVIEGIVPQDIIKKKLIINEISIKTPTQLDQLNYLSYQCTDYIITLTNKREMNLSNKECLNILNSIIDNYIIDFRMTYGYNEVLGTLIAGDDFDFCQYEYVQLFDIYSTQVEDILRFLDNIIEIVANFRSTETKLSFEDMRSRVKSIRDYDIKSLENYVFDKGVARVEDSTRVDAVVYIEERVKEIQNEIVGIEKACDNLKELIENFKEVYNIKLDINAGMEWRDLVNGDTYKKNNDIYIEYQIQLASLESAEERWASRGVKFEDALLRYDEEEQQAHRNRADVMMTTIDDKLASEISYINTAVDEFINDEVMKNSINKSIAGVKRPSDGADLKLLVLAELLTVFLTFVVVLAITSRKEKKLALLEIDTIKDAQPNKEEEQN